MTGGSDVPKPNLVTSREDASITRMTSLHTGRPKKRSNVGMRSKVGSVMRQHFTVLAPKPFVESADREGIFFVVKTARNFKGALPKHAKDAMRGAQIWDCQRGVWIRFSGDWRLKPYNSLSQAQSVARQHGGFVFDLFSPTLLRDGMPV